MQKSKNNLTTANVNTNSKQGLTALPVSKKPKSVKGDVNSKRIFESPYLCAQFLRDYSGLTAFENVRPEDIEFMNLRYHLFEDVELNADSAVRILRVRRNDGFPIYIIPLIDHKSEVDYNVGMQLLYYMTCIWKEWEKEMAQKGYSCKAKTFEYPMIYPIVYYEGSDSWTADCHFSSRIHREDFMKKFTPEFMYHVVRLHDYSDSELLNRGDEMSLVMLLNKIQHSGDIEKLRRTDFKNVDRIIADTPENVLGLIAGISMSLCHKLNVPEDEANDYVEKIRKERRMGYLFENMEKMDIQAERRKTAAQTCRADRESRRADKEAHRADEEARRADEQARRADEEACRADEQAHRADEAESRLRSAESEIRKLQEQLAALESKDQK